MKKTTMLLIAMAICSLSFSQNKKDIIAEIQSYYKTIVSNASYKKPQKEIWQAMYSVVMESYPDLIRESESRGYIDSKLQQETYQSRVNAEIRGDKQPYRVVFTLESESRGWNVQANTYFPWVHYTKHDQVNILKLQTRLYEMLNGQIKLSDELQNKIETYNSEKKGRRKIIKGKDY